MCLFDVCLSVCLCVCSGPVNQTNLEWASNANSFKTVKATDFKFDVHVSRDSPDMTLKIVLKGGVCESSLGGDMHSHERLLVIINCHSTLCCIDRPQQNISVIGRLTRVRL